MAGKHRRGAEPELDPELEPGSVPGSEPAHDELEEPSDGAGLVEIPVELPVVSLVPGHASTRRAAREQRKHQVRRIQIVAAVVVVALVAGLVWFFTSSSGGTDETNKPVVAARGQHTVLLQVVDAHQSTLGAVLLAHDSTGQGSGFGALIPATLLVNTASAGSVPLSATTTNGGPDVGPASVADAMGVTVDGGWQLSTTGLASLVDAVGGVDVTVDENIEQTAPSGSTVLLIPAGQHHLAGDLAATYATYIDSGAPEQQRLARLATVLQALVGKLPAGQAAMGALVSPLVTGTDANLPPSRIASFLEQLRGDAVGGRLSFDNLPTHPLDAGGTVPTVVVDNNALPGFIKTNFTGSVPTNAAGAPFSVLVQNGVGTPGLDEKARRRLEGSGISYINGANAVTFTNPTSTVLIADGSDTSQRQGAAVAKALGLPTSDIKITDQGQNLAAVVVILGDDFKP